MSGIYNKVLVCVSVIAFFSVNGSQMNTEPWTWFYQKKITPEEIEESANKHELIFSHKTHPFTQLVFSWNALRPSKGNFIFYVQTRDALKKNWGSWHKMMAWGATLQESYKTDHDGHAQYHYVRLETHDERLSDAFRIKIVSDNQADMKLLHALYVTVANFKKFKSEVHAPWHHMPSVYVDNVPKYSQFLLDHPRHDGLCSPTSCSMLTAYLSKNHINPIDFAERSYDYGLGVYGSWPFNMAHAYERCGGTISFATARFDSFKHVYMQLKRGIPVVVSVRGPLKGAAGKYAHGHLLAIVGWDREKGEVVCHDPAFKKLEEVVVRYEIKDFLEAWERSRRLVYLAEPKNNS